MSRHSRAKKVKHPVRILYIQINHVISGKDEKTIGVIKLQEWIKEYLDMYIKERDLTLTTEQYSKAYAGVEYWLSENIGEVVKESINNVFVNK